MNRRSFIRRSLITGAIAGTVPSFAAKQYLSNNKFPEHMPKKTKSVLGNVNCRRVLNNIENDIANVCSGFVFGNANELTERIELVLEDYNNIGAIAGYGVSSHNENGNIVGMFQIRFYKAEDELVEVDFVVSSCSKEV